MKDNMKQLLDILCNLNIEISIDAKRGKIEKLTDGNYWFQPGMGQGFELNEKMFETLEVGGFINFWTNPNNGKICSFYAD
jgi:hypothetical protein